MPAEAVEVMARDKAVRRIALLVGLAFLAPALVLTFVGPSARGEDCGTWLAPRFTSLTTATMSLKVVTDGGSAYDQAELQATADECSSKLDTRRALALSLIAVGLIARLGIPTLIRRPRPTSAAGSRGRQT